MKYFYIDTNQYRHLFSESEGFSDDVHELICNLVDNGQGVLLLPQQTLDELERHISRGWPDDQRKTASSEIRGLREKAKNVRDNFTEYEHSANLAQEIDEHATNLESEVEAKAQIFVDLESAQNRKLQSLVERADKIVETDTLYERAVRRFNKGNPPYDKKIGDHIIWESILERLVIEEEPELIFVANDARAWGKYGPDPWLVKEYSKKTGGRVIFVKALSEIPTLTETEQAKIRDAELRADIDAAINEFANSESYNEAGNNAQRLLQYKDKLDAPDYLRIIDAARTNYSIVHSWFTHYPLKQLLEDPENEGYVVPLVENIHPFIWNHFEKRIGTELKRQHDEAEDEDLPINLDDIPF